MESLWPSYGAGIRYVSSFYHFCHKLVFQYLRGVQRISSGMGWSYRNRLVPHQGPCTLSCAGFVGQRTTERQSTKSAWCRRALAKLELEKLVGRLNAKWILLSYSTDGIIPIEDLVETLRRAGRLSWVWRPYKRYRVSSQRPSPRPHTLEFVLMVDTCRPACPEAQQEILDICQNSAVSADNLLPANGDNR